MRIVRLLLIVSTILTLTLSSARAQPDAPPAPFGVLGGYASPQDTAELGAAWDAVPFSWAAFQPDDPSDFVMRAVPARWLSNAGSAGREVVGLITTTPPWASLSGQPYAVPDGLDLPVNDPANAWAAFVAQLARRYATRGVHHWIIYDQPNIGVGEGPVQFAGASAAYARLVRVAFEAAKSADPAAVIHTAALHPWVDEAAGREPYLQRLLAALQNEPGAPDNGYFFDVLTLRALNETAALWEQLSEAQALLERHNLEGKALWLEIGASPTLDGAAGGPGSTLAISAQQQADFIVQAAAAGLAAGVERIGVYRLADEPDALLPWGLLRGDGTRRPAFETYQTVIALFGPTVAAAHYGAAQADLVVLEQAERDVYVMWASGAVPVQFVITGPEVGEVGTLHAGGDARDIAAEPFDWPAAFMVDAPAALADTSGRVTVGGAPRVLVLPKTDFYRVAYALVNGASTRLK